MSNRLSWPALLLIGLALTGSSQAARESKISATKHNLSASGTGTTKSTTESQICVFCHTPHGAESSGVKPLWNKTITNKTYTLYTSSSLDATQIAGRSAEQPMGSSKLCLSCHDGATALGSVRVLRGQTDQVIGGGTQVTMPTGGGLTSGFTRNLGGSDNKDLSNDHPISVTYDSTLATRDGEMRNNNGANQSWGTTFGKRYKGGPKFLLPLEATGSISGSEGQVQCNTCHDPHIRETDLTAESNIKFLRAKRFQIAQPTSTYSATNDIICLACHDKGMQGAGGNSWAYSAHANSAVATQTYSAAAATTREFPANLPVWKAACLNCHDTHTVTGANKLLREGVSGSAAALEQTCYQCHSTAGATTLNSATGVPDIGSDFALGYRMPITSTDQDAGSEVHAIGGNFTNSYVDCSSVSNKCGADGVEDRVKLGTTASNRHVECTDCHNPHRVVKFPKFYGTADGLGGLASITGTPTTATHTHTNTTGWTHTNVASGVLRGTTGVEPSYTSLSFHASATNYTVRRGDPGTESVANTSAPDTKTYVTREYQVCLKCHSTYAYTSPPNLRADASRKGLTGSGVAAANGLTQYTDQAKEFQAPATHADEPLNLGTEAGAIGYNTNNHRSWHPVMRATGRTATKRSVTATDAWNTPWSNAVGTQTMYCSDCHGSNTTTAGSVIPDTGKPWGPHGSANPFILKGSWDAESKSNTAGMLCLKCHNPTSSSGFSGGGRGNLHAYHVTKLGTAIECTWCHVAVPHGWKNRSLLVNLNDVGEEAGLGAGASKEVNIASVSDSYTQPPYYLEAKNKIVSFAAAGSWGLSNCGSAGKSGTGLTTGVINSSQGTTTNKTTTGKDWMLTDVCSSAPP